jgi:hypothetical protein
MMPTTPVTTAPTMKTASTNSNAAWYEPGERWLVVAERAMVVSDGTSSDAVAIWRAASGGAGAGDLLLTLIRRSISADGWSDPGAFAIAVAEPAGLRVLVRAVDDVVIRTANDADVTVGTSGLLTWTEVVVPDAVEVRIGSADVVVLPVPVGVVRAGALRWEVPGAERVDLTPEDEPADERAAAAIAPAVAADALPMTEAAGPGIAGPGRLAQRSLEETRVDLDADELRRGGHQDGTDAGDSPAQSMPADVIDPADSDFAPQLLEPADRDPAAAPPRPELPRGPLPDRQAPPVEVPGNAPSVPMTGPEGAAVGAGWPAEAPLLSGIPDFGAGGGSTPGGYDGDHDGMTQLAEDLPVGYTPPPLPAAPPPGTVLAALCPAGHPNAPHSRSCRLCGQLIVEGDPIPVPRPVLARIRLSTGELVDVDRAVVIGRSPYVSRVAAADLPRLVAVPSPNQDISRAHVEIRPEDWHLVVADLDSTNGTTVRPPGRAPQRLRPGQEVVVEPGWAVELGDGISFAVEAV